MLTKEELPECPVATTVALIGSKWKLLTKTSHTENGLCTLKIQYFS